jgi:hypothetical protein
MRNRLLRSASTKRERRGAIMVFMAVSMVALLAMLVVALDVGSMQRHKRMLQAAADAGALAGAVEIFRGRPDSAEFAAASEVSRNGYTNGIGGTTVSAASPTTSGTFVGGNFVHVVVRQSVPTLFAGMFGISSTNIRAEATGGIGPAKSCLVVLDTLGGTTLSVSAGATLNATACNIVVNSESASAVSIGNNGTINAAAVSTVGGISGSDGIIGTAITGAPKAFDPLGAITMPAYDPTCDATNTSVSGTVTLTPGPYCGGLDVSNSGAKANLTPGLYVMRGGGLKVKGNATLTSNGAGVTIILTGDATWPYGGLNFQANSNINLTADTDPTNPLAGIVIYQDPAAPAGITNDIHAGAGSVLNGTLYFPNQEVDMGSGSATTINGALVAGSVTVKSGGTTATINGGASPAYMAIKRATIVE